MTVGGGRHHSKVWKLRQFFRENARHIEVQIVADHHDNCIHLFERECTIQRKNQKVIEESPSLFLDDQLREELCETAGKGIQEIGYTNLGTMEFIFDNDSGDFSFFGNEYTTASRASCDRKNN